VRMGIGTRLKCHGLQKIGRGKGVDIEETEGLGQDSAAREEGKKGGEKSRVV